MTAAVIALALVAGGLGAGMIWAVREARAEGRLAIAQGKALLGTMAELVTRTAERDDLRGDVARLEIEVDRAGERIDVLGAVIDAARKELSDVAKAAVHDTPAADRGAAADRVLSQQRAEDDARAATADRGDPGAAGVPRPWSSAAEPRPTWAGDDDRGIPDAG